MLTDHQQSPTVPWIRMFVASSLGLLIALLATTRIMLPTDGNWKPDKDTESDVAEAKRTTGTYRFSPQIFTYQIGYKNEPQQQQISRCRATSSSSSIAEP